MSVLAVLCSIPSDVRKQIMKSSIEEEDLTVIEIKHEWLLRENDKLKRTAVLGVYNDKKSIPSWMSFMCYGGDNDDVLTVDDDSLEMIFDCSLWDECDQDDEEVSIESEIPSKITNNIYLSSYLAISNRLRPSCVLSVIDRSFTCDVDESTGESHSTIYMIDSEEIPRELLYNLYQSQLCINNSINSCGKIVIHCVAGVSRSAAIIAAWLILKGDSLNDALEKIKISRPWIRPNPGFMKQLQDYEELVENSRRGVFPEKVINFAPNFETIILNQTKEATTRQLSSPYENLKVGDFVTATSGENTSFAILLLKDVQHIKASEISDELARIENMKSAEELTNVLKTFYPNLEPNSNMIVFHFKIIMALPVETDC